MAPEIDTDYFIDGIPIVTPKVVYDFIKSLSLNHTHLDLSGILLLKLPELTAV